MGQRRRVGAQVVSFKDKVVMKTIRISLQKEAYVSMLCNCLAERAKNEQTFSTGGRWHSGNSFKAGEKVMRN